MNIQTFDEQQAAALDKVSTRWVQLHMALSEALELDFEPEEDIERYTEAIEVLKTDSTRNDLAVGISHDVYRALEAERDALNGECIAQKETIDHLEAQLAEARHQAAICAATADSYLADLKDIAYRLGTNYNGNGTVGIFHKIQRLQNR